MTTTTSSRLDLRAEAKQLTALFISRGLITPPASPVVQLRYNAEQRERELARIKPVAEAKIARWNAAVPVGSTVRYGRKEHVTLSKAWLFGGTPMINLRGVSGSVPLRSVHKKNENYKSTDH